MGHWPSARDRLVGQSGRISEPVFRPFPPNPLTASLVKANLILVVAGRGEHDCSPEPLGEVQARLS